MNNRSYSFILILALLLLGDVRPARAFTLGGPFTSWQQAAIGYQLSSFDLSGPMNISEEYRINVPDLTYAFDSTFLNYFGSQGETAIIEAFNILNSVPSVSSIDLNNFPLQAKGPINFTALNLNLLDIKSFTLGTLVAQMGLGAPERFTWCLRDRVVIANTGTTNYLVIQRNFDPFQPRVPTNVVNGTTYTYTVFDPVPPATLVGGLVVGGNYSDAIEVPVDPLASDFSTLGGIESSDPFREENLSFGEYFTGFTRDDMAAWRYIYAPNNFNIEDPPTGVALSSNTIIQSPFFSFPGASNSLSTNPLVTTALRPGVQKISFNRVVFDSLVGTTLGITNEYQDTYITNGTFNTQLLERAQTEPDILFRAEDLGTDIDGTPVRFTRTDPTGSWVDNSALNTVGGGGGGGGGGGELYGPGVIEPLITMTFTRVGPHRINNLPFFVDENQSIAGFAWAHFDTANIFAIFPNGSDVDDIESRIRGGETTVRPGGSPFSQDP
ncbi:MAG: hypothetical protein ACPGVU_22235 [Limisphaerales bacterium]